MKTPSGHEVTFQSELTLIGHEVVCDFIDMFFSYDNVNGTRWIIRDVEKENGEQVNFNGQHMYNLIEHNHYISFCEKNIRKNYEKGRRDFGGNLKFPDISIHMAAALVLAHELQHANQTKTHGADKLFYGYLGGLNSRGKPRIKQYKGRACERDAREFVDSHINEIFAYFNLPSPRRNKIFLADDSDELVEVANLLYECEKITMDDIRDELRASRILNPRNVQRLLEIMQNLCGTTESKVNSVVL